MIGPPEVVWPVVPPLTATLVTVPVAPLATLWVPVVMDRPVPREIAPVVPPRDATVFPVVASVPVVGSVRVVAPVAVNVVLNAPDVARVLPLAIVRTPVVLETVRPFRLVAEAAPRVGVVSTGLVARTIEPEPVVAFPSAVRVPVVGIVTDVVPVVVTVSGNAPTVVTLPAMVIVFVPLLTPVPPEAPPSVPARVIVPAPVTGPPVVVRPVVPPLTATLVTVPVAPFATLRVPVVIDRPVPRVMVPVVPPSDATVFAVVARVPVVGSVRVVAPVAVNVVLNAPDVARVLPLASVRTPVVLLIVRPLTLVAVAAPSVGVTSTGLVARTTEPDPVLVVTPVPP